MLANDPRTGGRDFRERIGIVLQEAGFDEDFTVAEPGAPLPTHVPVAVARDHGVLKRLRGTPLRPLPYLAGRLVAALLMVGVTAALEDCITRHASHVTSWSTAGRQ